MGTSEQYELPRRVAGLVSREVDGGFIVLDNEADQAHHLFGLPAEIWRAAGGPAPRHIDEVEARDAVEALIDMGLLQAPASSPSRRGLLRTGGLAVAAVGIQTIALPSAAWAVSANSSLPFPSTTSAGPHSILIPDYVNTVTFKLAGGSGGGAVTGGAGGAGALIEGTIQLVGTRNGPTTLTAVVGQGGSSGGAGGASGFSAGGSGRASGAGGGGGASAIRFGTQVLVVAGGGGGGGQNGTNTTNVVGGRGGTAGLIDTDNSSPTTESTVVPTVAGPTNDLGTATTTANGFTLPTVVTTLAAGDRVVLGPPSNSSGALLIGNPYVVQAVTTTTTPSPLTTVTLTGVSGRTPGRTATATKALSAAAGDLGGASLSNANDNVTNASVPSSRLAVGDRIMFGSGSSTQATVGGLTTGTIYYVVSQTGTSTSIVRLATTSGGTPIVLSASGNFSTTTKLGAADASPVTFASGSSSVTFNANHGLAVDDRIAFSGVANTSTVTSGAVYWVVAVVSNTVVQIATTRGGVAIATNGTATGATKTVGEATDGQAGTQGPTNGTFAIGGFGGSTSAAGVASPGAGGTAGPGANGAAGATDGGAGGVNTTSADPVARSGGGGGGGYGAGGGGEAGDPGGQSRRGGGGGGGSSFTAASTVSGFIVTITASSATNTGTPAGSAGAPGAVSMDAIA